MLSKLGKAMGGDFPLAGPGAAGVAATAEGEEEEEGEEADEDEPPLLTAASGGNVEVRGEARAVCVVPFGVW